MGNGRKPRATDEREPLPPTVVQQVDHLPRPAVPRTPDPDRFIDADFGGLGPGPIPEPIMRAGRYEILGRLAQGGMAEIYLARETVQSGASRLVVLKFVRPGAGVPEQSGQMFLREAKVAMVLAHPHICHVYDVGIYRNRWYMAMEFVHGVTLRDLFRHARQRGEGIPTGIAVRIVASVAEALEYAHGARDSEGKPLGIVHRDVSPHNIVIGWAGAVKLLDFGVAKVLSEPMTQSGTIKGKFAYMSPEQAVGKRVDGRSDIFSLGVCLWELLAGRRLYAETSDYLTLRSVVEKPAPSLVEARPELGTLDLLCHRALAKPQDERFASAGEMQLALEQYLADMREVVHAGKISTYLREMFGPACDRLPELDRDIDVTASFSELVPQTAGPDVGTSAAAASFDERPSAALAPSSTIRAFRPWLVIAAISMLIAGLGVLLWKLEADPGGTPEDQQPARAVLDDTRPEPVPALAGPPRGSDGVSAQPAPTAPLGASRAELPAAAVAPASVDGVDPTQGRPAGEAKGAGAGHPARRRARRPARRDDRFLRNPGF